MKKYRRILLLMLCLPLLFSCRHEEPDATEALAPEDTAAGVRMIAHVTAISDVIEVEVIEGDYGASGPYWVVTGATQYFDSTGRTIGRNDIRVGDTVEIRYNGQVMMSYPPKIAATRITQCE